MAVVKQEPISWQVLTHTHREHTPDWYWALGLGTLVGIVASIYFGNFLLAVILGLGAVSIGTLAARGPREHTVLIDDKGVSMDGTLHPYKNIESFWVETEFGDPRLFLTTSGFLHPRVTVPLDHVEHAEQVRERLLTVLTEEEQAPHFGETLAEMLGL